VKAAAEIEFDHFNFCVVKLFVIVRCRCVAALPGHRADCCGGGDWGILVLPGGEEQQDNGIVQEHGAAVCAGRPRVGEAEHSGGGAGRGRYRRGEVR